MTNYIEILINLLVPDKRQPNTVAFLSPPANQVQLNHNNIFDFYKVGVDALDWDETFEYQRYNIVKYGKAVFFSLDDENLGNPPYIGSPFWGLITSNFIGVDQRQYFNGTKLVFEYGINKFFGTVYDPNTNNNSEIYVETQAPRRKPFIVALNEPFSDNVLFTTSTGFVRLTDTAGVEENLVIWVKDLNQLNKPTSDEIKTFADKYIVSGVIYSIQSY